MGHALLIKILLFALLIKIKSILKPNYWTKMFIIWLYNNYNHSNAFC